MTLPAGTYEFKLLDSNTDRHVVQIFNREGTKLFTTLLAVPATRREPSGDPVITFKETASNQAPAVHYWYYAGDLAGNELVYPKNQAQLIANASGESVMAVDSNGNSIDDWKSGSMSRVKPETTTSQSPAPAASTTAADTSAAKPAATSTSSKETATTTAPAPARPAPTPSTTTASADTTPKPTVGTSGRLPKTASELPAVALLGLFALGAALALRAARTA
jgi:hypothetical protein